MTGSSAAQEAYRSDQRAHAAPGAHLRGRDRRRRVPARRRAGGRAGRPGGLRRDRRRPGPRRAGHGRGRSRTGRHPRHGLHRPELDAAVRRRRRPGDRGRRPDDPRRGDRPGVRPAGRRRCGGRHPADPGRAADPRARHRRVRRDSCPDRPPAGCPGHGAGHPASAVGWTWQTSTRPPRSSHRIASVAPDRVRRAELDGPLDTFPQRGTRCGIAQQHQAVGLVLVEDLRCGRTQLPAPQQRSRSMATRGVVSPRNCRGAGVTRSPGGCRGRTHRAVPGGQLLRVRRHPQVGEATGQLHQGDAQFGAGQGLADALVHAEAEGQVLVARPRYGSNSSGALEDLRVAVGRGQQRDHALPRPDRPAADLDVLRGDPDQAGPDDAEVAQQLLDQPRRQIRAGRAARRSRPGCAQQQQGAQADMLAVVSWPAMSSSRPCRPARRRRARRSPPARTSRLTRSSASPGGLPGATTIGRYARSSWPRCGPAPGARAVEQGAAGAGRRRGRRRGRRAGGR